MQEVKGYKGFDENLCCSPDGTPYQYEVGKTYEEPEAVCCKAGLHFCENPIDVFGYYPPATSRYCEVEASGDMSRKSDGDSKVCATKLKVRAEIGLFGLIKAGVEYITSKINWDDNAATNTGNRSAATNTGYRSAATNTGDQSAATNTSNQSAATNTGNRSAATNTGYRSAATNTGYRSAATNTGYQSAATNTGDQSAATNTGYRSAATNTGNQSAATNTGYQSAATNTGDQSAATNTGDRSAATNTGDQSAASVAGSESVAISLGIEGRAKGSLGCWIVLAEWEQDDEGDWHRVAVKSHLVDGRVVLPDTWYQLRSGRFVKARTEAKE